MLHLEHNRDAKTGLYYWGLDEITKEMLGSEEAKEAIGLRSG
jgi:rhamnogalacturonyl hydrolase YesR